MARCYDGDTLIEFVKNNTPHINGETTLECVERAIREAPTADVVEVVRCKDCKNCFVYQKWNKKEYFGCCRNGEVYEVDGNHYCSYGERKD